MVEAKSSRDQWNEVFTIGEAGFVEVKNLRITARKPK